MLEATAAGDLLVVQRRRDGQQRVLVWNLGAQAVSLPPGAAATTVLVRSDGTTRGDLQLAPGEAVLLG